jgi:TonB family protein
MAFRLACLVGLLAWQQQTAPAVYQVRDVDAPPRLVREVKPMYTGEAIRARIQGVVTLSCVVLADGSVGDVHVAKSLDATYGLDDQAIIAVKQWRFSPAIKSGSPVAIVVNVDLSFTLKDGPTAPPPLTWPEGFDAPLDAAMKQAEWSEETFEVLNLRIRIAYPAGWALAKSPNERQILAVNKIGEATVLGISPPHPALVSMDHPLTADQLKRAADVMTSKAAEQGMNVESLAFGQAPAASHIWAWQAFRMASIVTPNMTPMAGAVGAQLYDGARLWEFQSTAGGSGFTVNCIAAIPRRLSESERAAFVTGRAAVFGEILRRMSITVLR